MSTFYLLPPRTLVVDQFTDHLKAFLPMIARNTIDQAVLMEVVEKLIGSEPDVYVVFRDDLPMDEDPLESLANGYGAEANDEIVELRLAAGKRGWTARRLTQAHAA